MDEILSVFDPLPPQRAFLKSQAKIRGYGGAMGGGKSRTGCETIFDAALDHPGIVCLIARQAHTSIVETTKKTMLNQVIDQHLIVRKRESGGEDFIELWNGSRIHFVGLEDPLRWYSSEIGYVFFDECQEISEDTALRIITRLRQRCRECETQSKNDCNHMPNRAICTFNPSNPGHWLQKWFMTTTEGDKTPPQRTEHGFYKEELWMEGATASIGTCEFFFAKAQDNIHLPPGYVESTLGGMKEWMRRRYLEGIWEFISGQAFFDGDSLREYQDFTRKVKPLCNGITSGNIQKDVRYRTQQGEKPKGEEAIKIIKGQGELTIFKKPVKESWDEATGKKIPGHRYVLAIDAASGRGRDFSAIQIIDVEDFSQVAEWQGKKETGQVAEEAYRLGRIYNDALIVPEITGGWGLAIDQVLKTFRYPRLYTRRVIDRLSQKYTDRTGWDTTTRTRMVILETLSTAIRERSLEINSLRTVAELGTFVYSDREKPEAQQGCNDDLVMALAIGVHVASSLPRQLIQVKEDHRDPQFPMTGW